MSTRSGLAPRARLTESSPLSDSADHLEPVGHLHDGACNRAEGLLVVDDENTDRHDLEDKRLSPGLAWCQPHPVGRQAP